MTMTGILMAHMIAHREQKPPFFFSRYNLEGIRRRGNTHYCFHCGGHYGFVPGPNGEPTNHMDDKIALTKANGERVLVKEALKDARLEPHITDSAGYPRYKPGDGRYEEWLKYSADFNYSPAFAEWCEENGYAVFRYNPMKDHDPVTHADAVIGGANRFDVASKWLEENITSEFPYLVAIT